MGHADPVAWKHYVGRMKVSSDAETLENAMGIEALADTIIASIES